jgi:hypothetical protein
MVEIGQGMGCPECGAPLKVRAGEAIITCEYCGSAVNLAVGTKYFLKHTIIPSKITQDGAANAVKSWMKRGFLKPSDLARKSKIVSLELQFLPMFIIHAVGRTKYEGKLTRTGENIEKKGELDKEYYWKVLGRRASTFPTRSYEVPLSYKVDFDTSKLVDGARFLNSEMDEKEAESIAESEIKEHHRFLLQTELDVTHSLETTIEFKDTEFLHVPAWFVSYQYQGKIYELILDGATGDDIKAEIPSMEKKGLMGKLFGA